MVNLKPRTVVPSPAWLELNNAIGIAYRLTSTGWLTDQSVGVADQHLVALGVTSKGTFGLALDHPCEVKVVDGYQRTIAVLNLGHVQNIQGEERWIDFHSCAVELMRSAEDRRLPIQGRIVGTSPGRYHVDLGAELTGYMLAPASSTGARKPVQNRLRFFEVKKISQNADEIEVALWSSKKPSSGSRAQVAYDEIIRALAPVADTDDVGLPVSLLLLQTGRELSRDASSAEIQAASTSVAAYLKSVEAADLAGVAVSSARAVSKDDKDLAIGVLQLAECELARRFDRARLGFVQVEMAKLMRVAGRDVSARLYAQAGARSALASGATRIARAALDILRGLDAPPVRA